MSKKNPALAKPSDLAASEQVARSELQLPAHSDQLNLALKDGRTREGLPAPMHMRLHGGELVELTEDQVFNDKVVIRAGERGRALQPSSQAAAWVVHFPRVGRKRRVIPEPLLRIVEAAGH
ncbi:MAG TPA: hypothetical protein DEA08_33085 [Planctomycetes bacterium]|nr:hypothetical protein [Planctomycetota bacterium]